MSDKITIEVSKDELDMILYCLRECGLTHNNYVNKLGGRRFAYDIYKKLPSQNFEKDYMKWLEVTPIGYG